MMCFSNFIPDSAARRVEKTDEREDGLKQKADRLHPRVKSSYQCSLAKRIDGQKDKPPYFSPCSGSF